MNTRSSWGRNGRKNKYDGIDKEVEKIAVKVANRAVKTSAFSENDRHDLEQELIMAGLKALESFDPEKGHKGALLKTAMTNHLDSLRRNRRRKMRDSRVTSSLNQEVIIDGEDASCLIDLLPECGCFGPVTREQINPYDNEFYLQDIRNAIQGLPDSLRMLCEDMQTMSIRQIAEKRKVSRKKLYRHIAEIRKSFAEIRPDRQW
jgi:RNA polymerase sigma factor (sigma-70 family)